MQLMLPEIVREEPHSKTTTSYKLSKATLSMNFMLIFIK